MKVRESIQIDAPPETVWFFLDDPELVQKWSPKLVDWEPVSEGEKRQGYTFRIRNQMGSRLIWSQAVFSEYQPYTHLVWTMSFPDHPKRHPATLTFTLVPNGNGTHLTQELDLNKKNIPLFWRPIVRFIMAFGKPQGEPMLSRLKRLAEGIDR